MSGLLLGENEYKKRTRMKSRRELYIQRICDLLANVYLRGNSGFK